MINWCTSCLTSLSDLEVAQKEQADKLYHVRYPAAEGDGGLVVATETRPERCAAPLDAAAIAQRLERPVDP
jgi:valyl-tRNA synthetase